MSKKLYEHLISTNSFGITDRIKKETKPFKPATKPVRH